MSELIGKVTSCNVTDNGISFSVTNGTGVDAINKTYRGLCGTSTINWSGTGLDAINKTYRDLCGQSGCGTDLFSSHYPSYSISASDYNIPVRPFTAYAPVPKISDVKVYNDKAVRVLFNDGTTETAVCQEGDKFDLDMGITVCIMKKMLGRNEYFRMLKKAKKTAAARRELEKKSAEAVEIRKRQRAKKEAKKRARREKRNKELAAAIAKAMNTKKKA